MADLKDTDALASKYVEFLRGRFSKTPTDWTPIGVINKPSVEYKTVDEWTEILFSVKSLFKKIPKLRFLIIPLKATSIAASLEIIEKLKPSLNLDVYTVIIFINHESPKQIVDFVVGYNNDSSSLFLVEPETGVVKFDYKSITKNYLKGLNMKAEPIPTKERLTQLAEKSGNKTIISVMRVREEYSFTHGQALDFLHACKFLKRDGLTNNYIFK